jgi:hypothetical protein
MPLHLFKRGARVLPQRQAMLIATGCDQRNAMIFGDLIIKQVQEPFFNTISFAQDIENQRVGQIVFFGVHTYQNSLLKRGGGEGVREAVGVPLAGETVAGESKGEATIFRKPPTEASVVPVGIPSSLSFATTSDEAYKYATGLMTIFRSFEG